MTRFLLLILILLLARPAYSQQRALVLESPGGITLRFDTGYSLDLKARHYHRNRRAPQRLVRVSADTIFLEDFAARRAGIYADTVRLAIRDIRRIYEQKAEPALTGNEIADVVVCILFPPVFVGYKLEQAWVAVFPVKRYAVRRWEPVVMEE